jgi:hypothetical protein
MALLSLTHKTTNELDTQNFSLGIFIYLSKGFDTIIIFSSINLLITILQGWQMISSTVTWVINYRLLASALHHQTNVGPVVKYGVPQGLILAPMLFIIYINDIVNIAKLASLVLYADDINMFLTNSDAFVLIQKANTELAKFSRWFAANKLSLKNMKTNFILFQTRNKKINYMPEIKVDNVAVTQVTCTKFFGRSCQRHFDLE